MDSSGFLVGGLGEASHPRFSRRVSFEGVPSIGLHEAGPGRGGG